MFRLLKDATCLVTQESLTIFIRKPSTTNFYLSIHSFIIISSSGKISISLGRKVHSLLKRVSVYAQWSKFSPDFIAAVSVLVGKGRIW